MTLSFRRLGAFAALLLASAVVHAQAYTHQVFLDRDQDAATGCALATAAGPIAGIDTRLTATIAEYPASVQSLTLATCTGGAFGAETTLSGGYPVGYDLGAGGSDVIEFAVDAAALAGAGDTDWTLWFVSTGISTGAVDLVGPVTAQGLGGPAQPTANPAPVVIPALDPWAVLLLALAMGVCLAWAARRYRGLLPVLVVGAALSMAGIAWAAGYLLDGAIGDWDTAPLASDPAGDPTVDDPGADLRQVFAAREGARLFFRSDVAEAQIEKLIAGLLATAFSVDENPANGTVVGELRAVTTGLGSLLQFQLLGQGPASAFAVDADGTLSVADGSLVDAESTPVFTLDVQVSINGVAALTIQVDVTVTVDGVNEAPVVDAATFSIPEDSVDGAGVGTVTFADPDTGQAHVFAITAGDAGGVFAIDGSTGAITVADAAQLDFATTPSYALTVSVTDNGTPVLSGSATITIEITETDDPPVAVDDAATVAEDAPATAIDVLANDTDTDAGPMLVESVTQPANGTVAITGGGSGLTYAPNADYCNDGSPVDTFTYTLNGGSVATVAVTVTCVDDDPVAVDDAASVTEDDAATPILVLANDTDSDGGAAMSIASVVQPANGTVAIAGDSLSLTYQPAADYCNDGGPADTFTYALAPGGASATVSVAVACVDDLPVAVDDAAIVAEDAGATVLDVLANDTDVDGGPISVQSVTQPANGAVAITGGGTGVSYAPSANYCNDGSPVDSFTYTLNGGTSATVSVTVPCGDDAPVAVADAATVAEDSGASTIDVLANDTDLDGGPIAVQSVTQPANGTVVITNGGADLTYAPDADYCNDGSPLDTFAYTLNGGSSATVSVTVTCANDAPAIDLDADDDGGTAGSDYTVAYTEGDGAQPLQDATDATITDVDSSTLVSLTVTLGNLLDAGEELLDADVSATPQISKAYDTSTPGVGVLTLSSVTPQPIADYIAVLRTVTYANTSDAPDATTRTVGFVANDGALDSNVATAFVNLSGVDTAPVAVDDAATVAEDAAATAIDVLANDTDSDGGPIGIASVTQAASGAVVITGGGTGLTYAPDADYCNDPPGTSPDTFTYTLAPGGDTATVSVTVTCADDNPTAVADAATVTEDAGATAIDVLANDTDPDGGLIEVQSITAPANGVAAITGGGTGVSYTPDADYCNAPPGTTPDVFTYTLNGGSSTTVSVTVTCVDDLPVAVADAATVVEDSGANAIDVLANDTDAEGDAFTVTAVTQPASGVAAITGGGAGVTYAPNANYCNNPPGTTPDTFTYTLAPGGASTTVTVGVTCVDDPPVAVADAATVLEDAAATAVNVLANDTDVDGGAISISSVTQPANGAVVITGGGTGLTYAPNANYCNDGTPTDDFTYTLSPGGSSTTVAMTVTCVNDPPTLANATIAYATAGNTQLHVDGATMPGVVSIADAVDTLVKSGPSDVDGPGPFTVVPFTGASANGGQVALAADGSFTYVPAAGFTGTDTVVFQVSDNGAPAALANGTIQVTVSEVVWYVRDVVDANNPAGGDGRSNNAFETLAAAQAASGANHQIFVFRGNTGTTALGGGITLKNGQKLHGEGIGLVHPTHGTLVAAGTRPHITNAAGNGVTVLANAANGDRTGIEVRGLQVSGSANAIDATSADAANLGLRISDNAISSAGSEGIDVNVGSTNTGQTLAVFDNSLVATGTALAIDRTAGALTITAFDDNLVDAASAGSGIVVTGPNVVFDAVPGGSVNTVAGNTLAIGTTGVGGGVGGAGIVMSGVSGDLSFASVNVYADGGAALQVTGTGTYTGATGLRLRHLAPGTGTLVATGGPAASLSTLTADLRPATITSTNSPTTGISLVNLIDGGGTNAMFSANAGSAISNATGTAFNVDGGNPTVSYAGTISNSAGRSVVAQNRTADSATFSGNISDTGSGVLVDANAAGVATSFQGGLALSTGTNAAFTASTGGTIEVCDESPCNAGATGGLANTVATTTGTALSVTGTTISANQLEFRSISANGAVNGIVLDTTGSVGSLRVKGMGSPGSGGTIQSTSGHAISLTSTTNPQFARMTIQNIGRNGVDGQQVTGFTFTDNVVNNVGTAAAGQYDESNIAFNDPTFSANALSGSVTITGNSLTNARRHGVQIENWNGTLAALTISNNTITSSTSAAASLGSGILVLSQGSAATTAHLTTATISGNAISNFPSGEGILVAGGSGNATNMTPATLGATGTPIAITGNAISGTAGSKMGSNAIRIAFNGQVGVANFSITNNGTALAPITHIQGQGISGFMGGSVTGTTTITNNFIVANQTLGAGTQGLAVQVDDGPAATGTSAADYNFVVSNNNVSQYEGTGVRGIVRASNGKLDMTAQGNTAAMPLLTNRNGMRMDSGSAVGDTTLCLLMTGNTSSGSGIFAGMGIRKQGTNAAVNDFGIVGLAPSPTTIASAVAKVNADNPAGSGTDGISGDNYTACTITP